MNILRKIVFFIAAFAWIPSFAQHADSTSYAFLVLKDGTKVSGKVAAQDEDSVVLIDFSLGKLTIDKTKIAKETFISNGNAYCFMLDSKKEYCGTVTSQNDSAIVFQMPSLGEIAIRPALITTVSGAEGRKVVNGHVWFKNPHGTRYFFMPNAIPLKKGEGYYQNAMLLVNTVNYGLTNHISIGGGIVVPFAAMLTAKAGFKVAPKVHVGGGVVVTAAQEILNFGIGATYGEVTLGDEDYNCSFATGFGFSKSKHYGYDHSMQTEWEFEKKPMCTASGMIRLANNCSFVTENWFYPETKYERSASGITETTSYHTVNSFGLRTLGVNSAFDFAVVRIGDNFSSLVLPYFGYVRKF